MAKKRWSFNAGVRGENWVRAFEDARDGKLYLEWREPLIDEHTGQPAVDERGRPRYRRPRTLLRDVGRAEARRRAERLAAQFAALARPSVTLDWLISQYIKEVTPGKAETTRGHDARAARVFRSWLAVQEVGRQAMRHPKSLDRLDWDRFISARRAGRIEGFGPVRDRQVQYDLKWLVAVLNWGVGGGHLEWNPWGGELRRVQRWEMPRERNPRRPAMTDEVRAKLISASPHWQFALALVLQRETRRRNSSIRRLRWSDVDLEAGEIRWRGEMDKSGVERVTPLTHVAALALRGAQVRGIGEAWVFPAAVDPAEPTPRNTWQVWLRRAKARAGVRILGLGYHSEKRAGVRDPRFRSLPQKMQEELAGTAFTTLSSVYDEVSVEEMREAMRDAGLG